MSFTISTNNQPVIDALTHLQQRLTPQGMHTVFNRIGLELQHSIQNNLGEGKTPYDAPFVPLKKPRKTQGSRIAGDVPLNDTHQHIYNKITFNADANGVEVGMLNDAEIGQIHQFGGTIHHAERSQKAFFKVNKNTGVSRFSSKRKSNFEQDVTIGAHDTIIPARPFLPIIGSEVVLPPAWLERIMQAISNQAQI